MPELKTEIDNQSCFLSGWSCWSCKSSVFTSNLYSISSTLQIKKDYRSLWCFYRSNKGSIFLIILDFFSQVSNTMSTFATHFACLVKTSSAWLLRWNGVIFFPPPSDTKVWGFWSSCHRTPVLECDQVCFWQQNPGLILQNMVSPSAGRMSACKKPQGEIFKVPRFRLSTYALNSEFTAKVRFVQKVSRLTCEPIDCASPWCAADELITTPQLAHYLYDAMC